MPDDIVIRKCSLCGQPVLSTHEVCMSCGAATSALPQKALGSTNQQRLRRSLLHLSLWWLLVLALGRFSLSPGALLLLLFVTAVYAIRLLRIWLT